MTGQLPGTSPLPAPRGILEPASGAEGEAERRIAIKTPADRHPRSAGRIPKRGSCTGGTVLSAARSVPAVVRCVGWAHTEGPLAVCCPLGSAPSRGGGPRWAGNRRGPLLSVGTAAGGRGDQRGRDGTAAGGAVTSAGENKQADAAYLGEGETLRQGGPPDASAGGSRAAGARGRRRVLGDQHPEHGGEAVAGGGDPPTITVAEVTSLCWFPSSAARQLAPGFDAWQTGREPQPVGRLAADPAELAAQHRVLVLDYQDFGILAPLRASRQTAEQAGARAGRRPRRSLSGDPTHSTAQGGPDRVIDRRTLQAPKRRALRQAGQRRECPTVDTLFWVGEIVTVVSR